ncbi:hypothetical protein L208DRAFT_1252515, partial [Tricholoma matsutake]
LQMNETGLPMFYVMALDYLPIQASAVPCKCVFSSSAETDMKRGNQIHLVLMEALQMVKFSLKNKRLNFTEGWITSEYEMLDDAPEDDLLGALLSSDQVTGVEMMDIAIAALRQDDNDK